jgi:hypothetical protein
MRFGNLLYSVKEKSGAQITIRMRTQQIARLSMHKACDGAE